MALFAPNVFGGERDWIIMRRIVQLRDYIYFVSGLLHKENIMASEYTRLE